MIVVFKTMIISIINYAILFNLATCEGGMIRGSSSSLTSRTTDIDVLQTTVNDSRQLQGTGTTDRMLYCK